MKTRLLCCILIMLCLLCACSSGPQETDPSAAAAVSGAELDSSGEAEDTADADVSPEPSISPSPAGSAEPEPTDEPAGTSEPGVGVSTEPSATPSDGPPAAPGKTTPVSVEPAPLESAPGAEPTASAEQSEPYSTESAETVLHVYGEGVDRDYYFTLAELKDMSAGVFTADYFSRGREGVEDTSSYTGIRIAYFLDDILTLGADASSVTVKASDGYAYAASASRVRMKYIDENEPDKVLYMILAWEENGAEIDLNLVMGQMVKGEFNRQYWVQDVVELEIK